MLSSAHIFSSQRGCIACQTWCTVHWGHCHGLGESVGCQESLRSGTSKRGKEVQGVCGGVFCGQLPYYANGRHNTGGVVGDAFVTNQWLKSVVHVHTPQVRKGAAGRRKYGGASTYSERQEKYVCATNNVSVPTESVTVLSLQRISNVCMYVCMYVCIHARHPCQRCVCTWVLSCV